MASTLSAAVDTMPSHGLGPELGPGPLYRRTGTFPCHQCGKTYRWKGNLSQHLRFECGKAPQFKCPYCPYRSKHRSDLKNKHMKCRHPGLPLVMHQEPGPGSCSGSPSSFGD